MKRVKKRHGRVHWRKIALEAKKRAKEQVDSANKLVDGIRAHYNPPAGGVTIFSGRALKIVPFDGGGKLNPIFLGPGDTLKVAEANVRSYVALLILREPWPEEFEEPMLDMRRKPIVEKVAAS